MFAGFLIGFLVCLLLSIFMFLGLAFYAVMFCAVLPHTSMHKKYKDLLHQIYVAMHNHPKTLNKILNNISKAK